MNELFSSPDLADFSLSMHLAMVRDSTRVQAYSNAISQIVSEGDVVLDIGSGTGILSVLAATAGAKKVYSVENSRIAEYSKKMVSHNGLSNVIEVLNQNIFSADLPEISADVVISELFGTFGIGENVIRILNHVRDRLMKKDGVMIPGNMDLWVAPLQCEYDYHQVTNWDRKISGIDFSPMQELAYNAIYGIRDNNVQLLAEPCMAKSIDFTEPGALDVLVNTRFDVNVEGVLHGVAGWFLSELCPGVVIDNGPESEPTHWGQILFPTGAPKIVKPGDRVDFGFEEVNSTKESVWRWMGGVMDGSSGNKQHSFDYRAVRGF